MKRLLSLAIALSASACFAIPPADKDSPEYKRAQALIQQLGSNKYRDREKAAAELVKMGRSAKDALMEAKADPDSEVSTRAGQLLPQALALDLQFRIDRFIKDTDGKLKHDLPMLKIYREKIGTDENARKLFADMLLANGSLLEMAEDDPSKLTDKIQQRYQEMYQEMFPNQFNGGFQVEIRQNKLNSEELCCLLFAASSEAYKPIQPDWMLSNLFTQPNFTTHLKDDKGGSAYRKVFFHYLGSRMDDNTINQCVWMLSQNKVKGSADIMAKAIKDGKAIQVYTKANAMCCVGTLGDKTHLPVFDKLLKDSTKIQAFNNGRGQNGEVKVQDIALAMTIHLNGKNPKEFGFIQWNVYPNQLIQYHQLGFTSEEERKKSFKKWEEESKKPATKKDEPKKATPKKADPQKEGPKIVDPPKVDPKKSDSQKDEPKKAEKKK